MTNFFPPFSSLSWMGILDSFGSFQVILFCTVAPADPPSGWFRHTCLFRQRFPVLRFALAPLPIPNLRQILAVFINVMLVLDEIVLHLLLQVGTLGDQV